MVQFCRPFLTLFTSWFLCLHHCERLPTKIWSLSWSHPQDRTRDSKKAAHLITSVTSQRRRRRHPEVTLMFSRTNSNTAVLSGFLVNFHHPHSDSCYGQLCKGYSSASKSLFPELVLCIKGEDEQSIGLLKRALERTKQSAFIHHQLALCYKKKMTAKLNYQKVTHWRRLCIQHLEEAVKIKTSFFLAIADLALLYGEEKDLSRAEELFQQGLQNLSEMEKGICQVFHLRYAQFHHYHTKKEAEAIVHYTEGLHLTPKKWEWKQCAKKLKQIAERRLSVNENDGQANGLLGLVAVAEGDEKKAVEFYEKALDCDENNGEYLSALCELRMKLH